MEQKPMLFGLLGRKLGHSWSAAFFRDFWEELGIRAEYRNFEIADISELPELLAANPDLQGFNVTVPYKQEIIPYLTDVWHDIDKCHAINTVKVNRRPDGQIELSSTNTDVIGFRESLVPLLRDDDRHALVLGTGGASQAVCYVLRELGIDFIRVSRRDGPDTISYGRITPEIMAKHTVIVNTTPLGMWPDTETAPDIPYSLLTPNHLCYDVVYNPPVTRFMALCAEQGARTCNGLKMLHLQALAAWDFWNRH